MPKVYGDHSVVADRDLADLADGGKPLPGSDPVETLGELGAGEDVRRRGLKEKAVSTTMYLLPEDHRRLRRMAIDHNVSFQTLMLDSIDLLLAREGEEPVGRWETRRKVR